MVKIKDSGKIYDLPVIAGWPKNSWMFTDIYIAAVQLRAIMHDTNAL